MARLRRPVSRRFLIGGAARLLVLAGVAVPALWSGEVERVLAVAAIALIGAVATIISVTSVPRWALGIAEAAATAAVCGAALEESTAAPLVALVLPPFVGGLERGIQGASGLVLVEMITLSLVSFEVHGRPNAEVASQTLAFLVLGLGLGLGGAHLRSMQSGSEGLLPYRDAMDLLEELLTLPNVLDSGLDAASVGAKILVGLQDTVPTAEVALWSVRDGEITPVVTGSLLEPVGHGASADAYRADLVDPTATGSPVVDGDTFSVVLSTSPHRSTVLQGRLSGATELSRRAVAQRMTDAVDWLRPLTVQLETAVLFAEVNATATRDERRRLAREMHDGVAQDIASMGYLVDAIVAGPLPDDVRPQVELLRGTITRVVAEVRTSVTALRMDVDASHSLGEAVAGLARRLSDSSGISIRCTVEERTARLRPEVEAELLRIAQEAMTNAVKHAGASEIDVECRVDAPRARLVVRDNGRGLGPERADSHGLTIMRERAQLVGAYLTIDSTRLGTVVHVNLGSRRDPGGPERLLGARP